MSRFVMLLLVSASMGLMACASGESGPVSSSYNLPQREPSTIPKVAGITPAAGTPSRIGPRAGGSSAARFPANPGPRTIEANRRAIQALRDMPVTPGDTVVPVTAAGF